MKMFAAVLLIAASFNCFAMRCDTQIIDVGDSLSELYNACGAPQSVYSDVFGDQKTLVYIQDGNITATVQVLNNIISDIQFNK